MSFERNDIKGTIRGASMSLLRAKASLITGLEDGDCILTPNDMGEVNKHIKDISGLLKDIKSLSEKFNVVAEARKAIQV